MKTIIARFRKIFGKDIEPENLQVVKDLISGKLDPVEHERSFANDDDDEGDAFGFFATSNEHVLHHLAFYVGSIQTELLSDRGSTILYIDRGGYNKPTLVLAGDKFYIVNDLFEAEKL